MNMRSSFSIFSVLIVALLAFSPFAYTPQASAAEVAKPLSPQVDSEVAAIPAQFLRLEINSNCNDQGALIKIVNRGKKWPRHGILRLYHADNKSQLTERKIRLASQQKVSFVIKNKILNGRPLGLWIEPEWYERGFEYDARISCN